MQSTIHQSSTQSSSFSSTGAEKYSTFSDLQKRYGDKVAKAIRAEKRRLQEKEPNAAQPYIMAHPDLPDSEDIWGYTLDVHHQSQFEFMGVRSWGRPLFYCNYTLQILKPHFTWEIAGPGYLPLVGPGAHQSLGFDRHYQEGYPGEQVYQPV